VGKPRILHWGRHISAEAGIEQNHAMIDEALISLDESSYHRRLAQTPGIALVLFSSPAVRYLPGRGAASAGSRAGGCEPCSRWMCREATGLAREFEIFHLPELFLYSHGQFHARLNCEVGATALGAALDKALAMPAEEEP
jgi:thioredoxin 1